LSEDNAIARDTPEEITFESEGHRRFAVARFRACGKAISICQRIPLHVLDMPDGEKEWHLDRIATELKRRVVMRRRVEAAHAAGH
jgi:hypothetical protein